MKVSLTSAALSTLVILTACNPKSPASNPNGFQEDYRVEALQVRPLSADQKAKLAEFTKSEQNRDPSTDLYFSSGSDKDSSSELAKLNDTVKGDVQKVKQGCTIDPGSDDSNSGNTEIGKTTTSKRTRKITGANCAVSFLESTDTTTTPTAIDLEKMVFTETGSTDTQSVFKVLDSQMAKDVLFVDQTTKSHSEFSMVNAKEDDNSSKMTSGNMRLKANIHSEYKMIDGQTFVMDLKMEQAKAVSDNHEQVLMHVTVPGLPPVIVGMFQDNDKSQIYLNGESYSAEEMKSKFGMSFSLQ